MRHIHLYLILFILFVFSVSVSNAEELIRNNGSHKSTLTVTAGCVPPSAATDLDYNNVRSTILTGGYMWVIGNVAQY
mgnify:CR=1 FL=1